jgi:hypothetical protein
MSLTGKSDLTIETLFNVSAKVTNIYIVNISSETNVQLEISHNFWDYHTDISLDRSAIHLCLCAIDRRKFNLCLKFLNKCFKRENSDEDVLILTEVAFNWCHPALPFSLGDQAALSLLKSGISKCPLALAIPLFSFETKTLHIPIFVNFLNKRRLIPSCMFAATSVNFHDVRLNKFLRNPFVKQVL